jgi:ATP-dependent DNA ligase
VAPTTSLLYYFFDVLILAGNAVMHEPLSLRPELLGEIMPKLQEPIRESAILDASRPDLITAVKAQGLEGLVAKRRDSSYEPGQRSGAWAKMRVDRAQEFVIGGYTLGGKTFDELVFGYYDCQRLIYVARTRNGFTPSSREALFRKFKDLETSECPFVNLPEARSGRWGEGLTTKKMKDCVWLRPLLVGPFEFLEVDTREAGVNRTPIALAADFQQPSLKALLPFFVMARDPTQDAPIDSANRPLLPGSLTLAHA